MSVERRAVTLVAHDPAWADMARSESARLRDALGEILLTVHHIGSTSIVGIKAKPIVDLMPVVRSLDELDARAGALKLLGYAWRVAFGIEGRRYCTLDDARTGARLFHVHFYADGWPDVRRHLDFRDYLRAHPQEARDYEAHKSIAAGLHPDDSHAYTDAKGDWIKACEQRAAAWALTRSQP